MGTPADSTGGRQSARWEALGTSVVLRLAAPGDLSAARGAVARELDAIDRACSRFRADSELSRVNAGAGGVVRVGPLLAEALALALRAAELTDGDVDPTVGRALELAGYDRDWALLSPPGHGRPGHAPASHARGGGRTSTPQITIRLRSGWREVRLDRESATVRIPRGVRLDLGATAKAWAADRAAQAAAQASGAGALVAIGGDVATAGRAPAGGWQIRVTDDHRSGPSAPGQTVAIWSGGLATSSTVVRRWRHNGSEQHHIIDPDTGAPARETWRTVSVAAADCTEANIATTAALVRAQGAPAWLARFGLPGRLVDQDGLVHTVGDWPAQEPIASRGAEKRHGRREPAPSGVRAG